MIIPIYRVVSSSLDVDSGVTFWGGEVVRINPATGKVNLCGSTEIPIGLAGDRTAGVDAFEWTNRASDYGNSAAASGMMTVYYGGEFWVDVDDNTIHTPTSATHITGVVRTTSGLTPGAKLYTAASGGMHTTSGSETAVAVILQSTVAGAGIPIDTGIPGETEPGSSVNYTDDAVPRTWVRIKLII